MLAACRGSQLIPPVLSLFTRFRPYLAHFPPSFARFHRLAEAVPTSPSRNPGPRNGGTRPKTRDLGPSFDAPEANQRINWLARVRTQRIGRSGPGPPPPARARRSEGNTPAPVGDQQTRRRDQQQEDH